jgi:hypothetical protein
MIGLRFPGDAYRRLNVKRQVSKNTTPYREILLATAAPVRSLHIIVFYHIRRILSTLDQDRLGTDVS